MRPPIDGGVVLITGVSSGIGREMAKLLGPRAKKLILVARRRERLEELSVELKEKSPSLEVDVRPTDLSDLDAAAELADQVGQVDVLINNAGLGDLTVYDKADWDKTLKMVRVNVEALALLTHRFLPGMVERKKGGILNVSSGAGMTFYPGFAVYIGTKHFVTGFTEALRLDLRGTGVVVTQLCPGPVATEFEQVTGNPTGQQVPGFLELSAERCARIAIRGFDRGKAMVIPGFVMQVALNLGAHTPRWIQRLLFSPLGPALRRKQADSV